MTTTHPMTSTDLTAVGCRLVATDGRALPLRGVDVAVQAGGGLASVRLSQRFVNPHSEPLSATYQLPLPADGAVVSFSFVIDGRRVTGRVERRADARAAFEKALVEGRTAGLLEQDRSSVFTQELANLPPGAHIEVDIDVEQPLAWRADAWEWRFPTVVAPRFLGMATEDAQRMTVEVADTPPAIPCKVTVEVADTQTGAATSGSHAIEVDGARLVLRGTLDRDVVVRWPVAAATPGVRLESHRPEGHAHGYGLLTVVPPALDAPSTPVPRDLILLLDTSGSMGGTPLAQLKAFSRALVEGLRPGDQLEMIEFSRSQTRFQPAAVPVDDANRTAALAWIDGLSASGGTHMHDAIRAATATLRPEAQRQVVLVTDGLIGFEHKIVGHVLNALPAGCRVHTVGIGSAPNRSLTGPVAQAGGGHEAIVSPTDPVQPAVDALLARTCDPLVVDVVVEGSALVELAPTRVPDLMAGSPSRVALSLRPEGGQLVLRGRTPQGSWTETLQLEPMSRASGRPVVATRFARDRVASLEMRVAAGEAKEALDARIEALGLAHQIATRLTSWVAETSVATVDPTAPSRHERIPQAMPHAMSAEGLGLRSPMPMATAPAPRRPAGPGGQNRGKARPQRRRLEARRSGAASSSTPPSSPRDAAGSKKDKGAIMEGLFGSIFDGDDLEEDAPSEMQVPEPSPTSIPLPPAVRLRARVRSHDNGVLVLEVTIDHDMEWSAEGPLVVRMPDGSTQTVTAQAGTTRSGPLTRGMVARLCIAWTGALPQTVAAATLVLELVA